MRLKRNIQLSACVLWAFLLPLFSSLHALVIDDHFSAQQINRELRFVEDKSAAWKLGDVQKKNW